MHSDRAGIGNTDRPCSKIVQHRHSAGALEHLHRAGRIRKLLTDLFQVILLVSSLQKATRRPTFGLFSV